MSTSEGAEVIERHPMAWYLILAVAGLAVCWAFRHSGCFGDEYKKDKDEKK
jgi:hypothetical protein